jgi:uncharacterized RDD family membrane protein YckC
MIAPVAPCPVCAAPTPLDWDRCGTCGAQRLRTRDGGHHGYARPGGPWRRAAATLVDIALFAIPAAIVLFALPDRIADPTPAAGGSEALLAAIVIAAVLYSPVAIGATGRTVGKRLLDLQIVALDGSFPDYPRAAMREGVGKVIVLASAAAGAVFIAEGGADGIIIGLLVLFPVGAAIGLLFADAQHRSLHDHLSATACVRGVPVRRTAPDPPASAAAPASPGPAGSESALAESAGSVPAG